MASTLYVIELQDKISKVITVHIVTAGTQDQAVRRCFAQQFVIAVRAANGKDVVMHLNGGGIVQVPPVEIDTRQLPLQMS